MLTSDAISEASQAPAPRSRSRLRGYLVRRGRQLRRALLILTLGLLFLAGVLEAWRGARMIGLPDIGDPFDVAKFRAFRVPEVQDAFVLLRQAQEKLLSPMPYIPVALRGAGADRWSTADRDLREWVNKNRDVLEMFRDAAERPDGILHRRFDRFDEQYFLHLAEFKRLALVEGSRLDEQGDMAGAWSWYRALFRIRLHVMRRGTAFQRLNASLNCGGLRERIATWAADSRTSVPLLRKALDDVRAGEPRPEWDVFSLKLDYLYFMSELDNDWGSVQYGEHEDQHLTIAGEELPPNLAQSAYAVRRYYSHEPERSRRVLRLAFANWLAFAEDEHRIDHKPAVRVEFHSTEWKATTFFYSVSREAPAAARTMTPDQVAKWLVSTRDARFLLCSWAWPSIRSTERREYRALVVTLARELFEREHGKPPATDQALVGPYLDHLPGDGSDELDDGTAPTVGDDNATATARPG
jgi:hypothetical protein